MLSTECLTVAQYVPLDVTWGEILFRVMKAIRLPFIATSTNQISRRASVNKAGGWGHRGPSVPVMVRSIARFGKWYEYPAQFPRLFRVGMSTTWDCWSGGSGMCPPPCLIPASWLSPSMCRVWRSLPVSSQTGEAGKVDQATIPVFRGAIVAGYSANRGKVAHIPRVLSTQCPLFSHISLHKALIQPLQQDVLGQVDADEHHLADALFPFRPLWSQVAAHQLVHALEDHLAIRSLHI